ncbi:MAG: tagatose 1,6-diphosphate aldolase [Peptoniphilaceae bacterium]
MNKKEYMEKLCDKNGIIAALAIDQRGSIRKMFSDSNEEDRDGLIIDFKKEVVKGLTPFASSILLDTVYGIQSRDYIDDDCGLIVAYEVTGYDNDTYGRLPRLEENWSVRRIKEIGASAVKILLYYDIDEDDSINDIKKAFIERIGAECSAFDIPFFLEIVTYDSKISDSKSREFARVKPNKVNKAVAEFSKERYMVDVLKLEVPVNMKYVEGFSEDYVYTKEEALKYFKEQSEASKVPFIFLSAGVTIEMFEKTLLIAKEAGSNFNGVLCGRATWAGGLDAFVKSKEEGIDWINSQGIKNIQSLNKVLEQTATPIKK